MALPPLAPILALRRFWESVRAANDLSLSEQDWQNLERIAEKAMTAILGGSREPSSEKHGPESREISRTPSVGVTPSASPSGKEQSTETKTRASKAKLASFLQELETAPLTSVFCGNCQSQTIPTESLPGGRVRCGKCRSVFLPGSRGKPSQARARPQKKNGGDAPFLEKWKYHLAGGLAAMVFIYVFFPTGSSGKPARVPVIPAQGKADFEGKPIPEAAIFLHPVGAKTPPFPRPRAVVRSDGTFVVGTYTKDDGAPPGEYKVTVQWFQRIGTAGNDLLPINLLPPSYGNAETSDLSVRIQEGETATLVLQLKR